MAGGRLLSFVSPSGEKPAVPPSTTSAEEVRVNDKVRKLTRSLKLHGESTFVLLFPANGSWYTSFEVAEINAQHSGASLAALVKHFFHRRKLSQLQKKYSLWSPE